MNSDQLIKFLTVVNSNSMTEAAESLFITQSALSHAISSLEEELNCKLFLREKRNLILTAKGKILYKYATEIQNILNSAVAEINSSEKIDIAAINVCGAYMLQNISKETMRNISIHQINEEDMPKALETEDVDIVACDDYYLRHSHILGLKKFLICKEHLALFVPEGHKFYSRKFVTFNELIDEPLCMRSDFVSQRVWMDHIEASSGMEFNIDFYMDRYTYLTCREKIGLPEIKQMSSIYNPNQQLDANYKHVAISDIYSSRFIYMWYLDANSKKIQPIIDSVKMYYSREMKQSGELTNINDYQI